MKAIIDFSKNIGKIKPINGVSNGPACHNVDLSEYFKESFIPMVRLHNRDEFSNYRRYMIDVSIIFENFDASEYDETNYRFEHTDRLILAADNCEAEIIYCLSESIDHLIGDKCSNPPKKLDKWCRICLQIIKHYNDGWANGYRLGIKYWEIWNEPEGHITEDNQILWSDGTFDQILKLYKKASQMIKEYDNSLKVGGLSFMYNDFAVEPFLKYCNKNKLSVDFLSFHHYASDLNMLEREAKEARSLLDKYGYEKAEIILSEWAIMYLENDDGTYWDFTSNPIHQNDNNKLYENQKSNLGASFISAFLTKLNDLPIDKSILYDFDPDNNLCPLFNKYYEPQKAYYAFREYGAMLNDSYSRAYATIDKGYIIASTGNHINTVIYSSFREKRADIDFIFPRLAHKNKLKVYLIDDEHMFDLIEDIEIVDCESLELDVKENSVLVFKFE